MGNFPAKSHIIITCTFNQVMLVEDLSWKLHIPSKIIPRYMGDLENYIEDGTHLKGMAKEIQKNSPEDRTEDIEEALIGYYSNTKFNWNITLSINSQSPIQRLISPSHEITVDFSDETRKTAIVELMNPKDKFFDEDFNILYRNESITKPMALVQKKHDEYAVMVSMLADLTSSEEWEERKDQIYDEVDLDPKVKYERTLETNMEPAEFIFLLDRSYSMSGRSIKTAKEAIILFLHSLPPKSKFNIVSFGNNYESIFEGSINYDQESMEKAEEIIKGFDADLGGTEIYKPLKAIFKGKKSKFKSLDSHVFLLTDGAVFDPQQCIDIIKKNSNHFNVHTFGIGSGACTELIIECARAGRGKYYFIDNSAEGLEK